jgi:low affinity Fe/Cu permease
MTSETQWLIGLAVTIIVAFGTVLITAFRSLTNSREVGDSQLHERINRVRDEYVRRVDLDSHLHRLDEAVKELRDETREGTRETNRRLDAVLSALTPVKRQ